MAQTRLLAVETPETEVSAPASGAPTRAEAALTGLLITSLKALSQRTVVALASLVDFALLASVFAALLMVINGPTPLQLTALAGYAIFVLVSLWLRRRST